MLLDIAHLIDSEGVERYQNKYSSASVLMKDCQMQLSGPWPPYHFVHRLTHHTRRRSRTVRRGLRPTWLPQPSFASLFQKKSPGGPTNHRGSHGGQQGA